MPLTLRGNRGVVALGTVVVLMAVALAMMNSKRNEGDGSPSSYSSLRRGGKAAYLLLKQSGYPAERWEHSPQDLPKDSGGAVLIIAEPESGPGVEERDAIARFLLTGGRVLVAGVNPHWYVPRSSALYGESRVGYEECKPLAPTRLTRGGTISQDGALRWDYTDESALTHYKDSTSKPVVVSYAVGKGEVIWWASAVPLMNSGIQDKGNLDLLLNSIGSSPRVLWDEYYHGYREAELFHGSVAALKWAGIQTGVVVLVVLLTFSRRSGPTLPLVQASRLSPYEFVETLGSVFHRAQSTQVAVEIASGRFRQIAARRLGLRGNVSSDEIVAAMTQRGLKLSPDMASAILASEDAASYFELTEKQAMEQVRGLNRAAALLQPPTQQKEE